MSTFLTSLETGQLAKALASAQGEMGAAKKDATNPHFKSRYADFASVVDASRPVLSKHGLAIVQSTPADGPTVTVVTRLMHTSGEWIESSVTMRSKDDSPQGIGSAITYGRRYGWSTLIGLAADDDDDGNKSSLRPTAQPERVQPPAGFDDWLTDLEATADVGTDALAQAWSQSPLAMRRHLLDTNRGVWEGPEGLKAKAKKTAAAVTA